MKADDAPGLMSQRYSALISSDSEYFQVCFSAVHYLKLSEQPWFRSEQRWKRKFSELKISAESELFQRWFSLKQSWFSLKQRWNTKFSEQKISAESELFQRWFSLKQLWNWKFSEQKISADSELFQRWFSLKQSWFSLKHQIFRPKNQRWIRAVSALIFSETALKNQNFGAKKSALNQCCFSADFPWNRADNHWSLLKQFLSFLIFPWDLRQRWTSLKSVFHFLSSPDFCNFSPGKLTYYAFWIIISYCFSANTRSFIFRETSARKLKSYGFWEVQSHYFSAKSRSYSLFADFLQETPDLEISGNLDSSHFGLK